MRKHKLRNDINTNTRGLTNHCGLQVNINGPGNMATWAPSVKECVEWVFTRVGFRWGLHQDSIRADTMFEAEQLPAGISNLDTCLAHMDWDALPLDGKITTELEVYWRKVVSEKRNLKECEFIFKWCVSTLTSYASTVIVLTWWILGCTAPTVQQNITFKSEVKAYNNKSGLWKI